MVPSVSQWNNPEVSFLFFSFFLFSFFFFFFQKQASQPVLFKKCHRYQNVTSVWCCDCCCRCALCRWTSLKPPSPWGNRRNRPPSPSPSYTVKTAPRSQTTTHIKTFQNKSLDVLTLLWRLCCRHATAHAHSGAQRARTRAPPAGLRLWLHSGSRLHPAATAQLWLRHVKTEDPVNLPDSPTTTTTSRPDSTPSFHLSFSLCFSPASHGRLLTTEATSKQQPTLILSAIFVLLLLLWLKLLLFCCYQRRRLSASKDFYLYSTEKNRTGPWAYFHIPYLWLLYLFFSVCVCVYVDVFCCCCCCCQLISAEVVWLKLSKWTFEVGGGSLDFALEEEEET